MSSKDNFEKNDKSNDSDDYTNTHNSDLEHGFENFFEILKNKSSDQKNESSNISGSQSFNQKNMNLRKRKKHSLIECPKSKKTKKRKTKKRKKEKKINKKNKKNKKNYEKKSSERLVVNIFNSMEKDKDKQIPLIDFVIPTTSNNDLNQLEIKDNNQNLKKNNYKNSKKTDNMKIEDINFKLLRYEKTGLINFEERKYLEQIEKEIISIKNKKILPKYKIMLIKSLSIQSKIAILDKIEKVENNDSPFNLNNEAYQKNKKWVESICQIPFDIHSKTLVSLKSPKKEISLFLSNAKNELDKCIYGQEKAKEHILEILAGNITNPETVNRPILFLGEKGTGKTSIAMCLSKILNRPFFIDNLGGKKNSEDYTGYSFTYLGSQYGKIVDWLIKGQCMNPIILGDELDKLSYGWSSNDIASLLTHVTDSTQNHKYTDNYFQGVEISLSGIQWIFSANNIENINPILLDRLIIINFESFDLEQKITISKNYIIEDICKNIGLKSDDYEISDNVISHLIKKYTEKGKSGVRNIKKIIEVLFSKINLLRLPNNLKISYNDININNFKNKKNGKSEKNNKKRKITIDMCDNILKNFRKPKEKHLDMYQ